MMSYREGISDGVAEVRDVRLFQVSTTGFDLSPGGLSQPTCVAHLTIVDMPNATAYLCPLNRTALQALAGQIEKALRESEPPPEVTSGSDHSPEPTEQ